MEYTKFGDQILQRVNESTDDWEQVPLDDVMEAGVAVGIAEEMRKQNRSNPPRVATNIIRNQKNQDIAAELGITADELADRLARPDHNQGILQMQCRKKCSTDMLLN